MTPSRLYFLGVPRFERAGRPVELAAAKAVALLAYLAATRTPRTRDHLVALLWPDSSGDAARKNLRNTLWAIRRRLGDGAVRADADRLVLSPDVTVDLWEFESATGRPRDSGDLKAATATLAAAVDLYRGPFLDGLVVDDAPDFEIWLTAERERLAQSYLRALAVLVDERRAGGDWRGAIGLASRALAADNLQEPMYQALMEAHARLGERVAALHQYATLRTVLERELGVEPLAETEALRSAILAGDIRPAGASRPAVASAPAPPRPVPPRGPAGPRFVGRQAEWAILDAELEAARGGRARAVLLTGPLGIGKSRLWQEWSVRLPEGSVVLEIFCLESTQALPFRPLVDLFSSPVCVERLATRDIPLPTAWLAEIARFVPELSSAMPGLPPPTALPPEEERSRVFEAFTRLLLSFDVRPLVLFVDDLHWADRATLDWLGYLVRRLRDQPLLVVATYRPEDAPPAVNNLVAGWGREGLARRVPLDRLSNEEAAALIASLGVQPRRTHELQALGAGNPYFLVELSRAAPGDVPPALADLVRARLDRLPDPARQVLQAAAVLEADFEFNTLRRTSGRGEEETLDALDALLDAAVLAERDGHYVFAHPLVAAVVRDRLSDARRTFLHRRAAEALEATHAGRLPPVAGRLLAHYAAAGDSKRAAHYAEMAGERALALAAPDEAVNFYRRAVTLDPTPDRQAGLGDALWRQGDLAAAREALEASLAGLDAEGSRAAAGRVCLTLAETYIASGRFGDATRWIERSLSFLDAASDPQAHALVHLMRGASQLDAGSLDEAETQLAEVMRLATQNNLVHMASRSLFVFGNLLAERGDLAGARRAYAQSIAFATAASDDYQLALGHNNAAYHALLAGDLPNAREHVEAGLALSEARALRLPLQYLFSTRGEIALAESQWDEAEDWFRRGLAEAERNGNRQQAANYYANLGLAARGRGDLDAAVALLEQARETAAGEASVHLQIQVDLWLAELYFQRGHRADAHAALARADDRLAGAERRGLQAWAARLKETHSES